MLHRRSRMREALLMETELASFTCTSGSTTSPHKTSRHFMRNSARITIVVRNSASLVQRFMINSGL